MKIRSNDKGKHGMSSNGWKRALRWIPMIGIVAAAMSAQAATQVFVTTNWITRAPQAAITAGSGSYSNVYQASYVSQVLVAGVPLNGTNTTGTGYVQVVKAPWAGGATNIIGNVNLTADAPGMPTALGVMTNGFFFFYGDLMQTIIWTTNSGGMAIGSAASSN